MDYLKRLLVGKPLKSAENDEHKLTRFAALALLSSDALSSIAYGTEQIVVVLVALSAAAIWYSLPIAAFVIILLISLTLSYRQIIHAYPHGGLDFRWLFIDRLHVDSSSICLSRC